MIKQLTALILTLATANPFCYCFANNCQNPSSGSSCCNNHCPTDDRNHDSPIHPDPSCPHECSCLPGYGYLEGDRVNLNKLKKLEVPALSENYDSFIENLFTLEVSTNLVVSRPPPNLELQALYCIYRT